MKFAAAGKLKGQRGYSMLELVATLGVLAVLVMGTIPMAQNALKRQKEQRLRDALAMMRRGIDEFKRDTFGACPMGAIQQIQGGGSAPADPRTRVVIDDCKIFESDNLDRYPPSLEMLAEGVRVRSRMPNFTGGSGISGNSPQATEINEQKEIIKVYLRELPVDPMTGEKDWKLRSSYQDVDSENWDEVNVFDVRSASEEESLNGEKYSDW
jgi:general secretion pathway protein G